MKMVIGSRTGIKEYEAILYPVVAPEEWNENGGIQLAPAWVLKGKAWDSEEPTIIEGYDSFDMAIRDFEKMMEQIFNAANRPDFTPYFRTTPMWEETKDRQIARGEYENQPKKTYNNNSYGGYKANSFSSFGR